MSRYLPHAPSFNHMFSGLFLDGADGGLACRLGLGATLDCGKGHGVRREAPPLSAAERSVRFPLQNVDVNLRDRFGNTALEDAIRHGHREVQKKLRSNGAVLHGHAVTLCQAAAKGDIDTIRVLIENGVDPNEGDYDGRTCLHLAACEGQLGVLHFLLTCHLDPSLPYAQKVNVNCVDSMGGTPLDDAIRHNQSVVEMILRQAGGVCQEDAEAMQDANRAQEKANQVRFNAEAQLVAKGILAKCREPKVAAQVQAYLSSLQGFVNELDTGYIELVTGLKDLVHVWKDAAAKKSLKPSDWTKKQAAIMEKLQHLMPLLSEWNSAIDNPPGLSPPVFNLLARRKDSDEGGGQQGREMGSGPADENMDEIDEVDYKESCLEAIDRLAATLECLHLMLGSRD